MTSTCSQPRFLLMQVRKPDDPMGVHEVQCFADRLGCSPTDILTWDLLHDGPTSRQLDACDIVLIGGSGDFSVVAGGDWLDGALDAMRNLYAAGKPTFASCWGCQAMAVAMGGRVVHDPDRAEVGTIEITLTQAGRTDPVFGPLGDRFWGQSGHEDLVDVLPEGAKLLASSQRTTNQAFRFSGLPIYCAQFHPELRRSDLLDRLRRYPKYIRRITGLEYEDFVGSCCRESPETDGLLMQFMQHVTVPDD